MLPYTYYLLKVIICSGILFGYYWLLLRNKIFHGYNRFYLLATVALSLVLPLIQINIWHRPHTAPQSIKLLTVVTSSNEYLDEIVFTAKRNSFTADQFIWIAYLLISLIFACLFIKVLINIHTLLKQHEQRLVGDIYLVSSTAKGTPFSFLKYIFWNDNIDITTTTGNQVFRHELAHVQQKHSYDKLFINAMLIFFWCNPFLWLIRKELNMIHEFMADKIAVEDSDSEAFAAMILQATYPQYRFPLTNLFFYSPIKRRLIMLSKNKNTKAGYIARISVLPLAIILFAAFTLKTKTYNLKENGRAELKSDTTPVTLSNNKKEENKLTENILYVLDGKVIGTGATASAKADRLVEEKFGHQKNKRLDVSLIKSKEATEKYGEQGKNGAVEMTVTADNKAILPGAVSMAKIDKKSNRNRAPSPARPLQAQDDKIFTKVENEPVFPGGDSAWTKYLLKNMQPDMPVKEGWKPGQYKIVVTFIVNKDGSLTDVKADNFQGTKTAQQCENLIKYGPRWKPAVQNNNIVTAYRKQPFTFVIENN